MPAAPAGASLASELRRQLGGASPLAAPVPTQRDLLGRKVGGARWACVCRGVWRLTHNGHGSVPGFVPGRKVGGAGVCLLGTFCAG